MTKKELMQLYYLNREIMNDTEELVNLKIECGKIKKGGEWEKKKKAMIAKREKQIVLKIRECSKIRDNVDKFISSIDDSLTRQVFYYRYAKCMTWRQVAYMIGGNNSDEGVRKIAERYLKRVEKQLL